LKDTQSITRARIELDKLRTLALSDYGGLQGDFGDRARQCLKIFESAGYASAGIELAQALVLTARDQEARGHGTEALALVERARPLIEAYGLTEEAVTAAILEANVKVVANDLEAAEAAIELAARQLERTPIEGTSEVAIWVVRARLARRRGDTDGALAWLERARARCIELRARGTLMRVMLNLGVIRYERRELLLAIRAHTQAVELAQEERPPRRPFLGKLELNLGLMHADNEGFKQAARHFEASIKWLDEKDSGGLLLRARLGSAKAKAAQGKTREASLVAHQLADQATDWIDQPGAGDIAVDLCEVLWRLDQPAEVLASSNLALGEPHIAQSLTPARARLRAWQLRARAQLGEPIQQLRSDLELLIAGPPEGEPQPELPTLVLEVAVELFEKLEDYRQALTFQRLHEERFFECMRGMLGRTPATKEPQAKDKHDALITDLVRHLRLLEQARTNLEHETSQRRLEAKQRLAAEARLEGSRRLETVGRLAGSVAHDFNNLLTVILGNLALVELGPLDSGQRTALEAVQIAGESGAALVRRLLSLGHAPEPKSQLIAVTTFINETLPMMRGIMGSSIALDVSGFDTPATLRGDATQLQSVLLNLLINARSAMPEGGRVLLECQLLDDSKDAGIEDAKLGVLRIRISDTGSGIPPESVEFIFDPLFTTHGPEVGSGIGLTSSRDIARLHGGDLRLVETSPSGTTFELLLPVAAASLPKVILPTPTAPKSDLAGRRILIAEDNAQIRSLACRALELAGAEVLAAPDGRDALALWHSLLPSKRPELVITDIIMPRLGGHELIEALRADAPDLPIITISAYSERKPKTTPRLAFLPKPFSMSELIELAAQQLTSGTESDTNPSLS